MDNSQPDPSEQPPVPAPAPKRSRILRTPVRRSRKSATSSQAPAPSPVPVAPLAAMPPPAPAQAPAPVAPPPPPAPVAKIQPPAEKVFEPMNVADLLVASPKDLAAIAASHGIETPFERPLDCVRAILKAHAVKQGFSQVQGSFDHSRSGFGFLRAAATSYLPRQDDVYVPQPLIHSGRLKTGDFVTGVTRPLRRGERYHPMIHTDLIWNEIPEKNVGRKPYDDLTPLFPDQRLVLETTSQVIGPRVIDLLAPLGRGQRALIVAPPRAGKTVLLQQIAQSIGKNAPDVYVIVLLLDERPEEVGNMRPMVKYGEVISSTFDEGPERHVRVAEFVMEKAHRMLESHLNVVVLMDSLTRYARACNNMSAPRGKLMSGGVESGALVKPRKFFSSARKVEEGGSLTIVATVLTETGSKMDDLIFEEFKGTGNMEIHLSRDLQERRIYPAVNLEKTGTRREELLFHPEELRRINELRRMLKEFPPLEAMEKLIEMLNSTDSNAELLMRLKLT